MTARRYYHDPEERLILLGCGGVGQALLSSIPVIFPDLRYDTQLVIIEARDLSRSVNVVAQAVSRGAQYHHISLNKDNLHQVLNSIVRTVPKAQSGSAVSKDIVVDLSVGIECETILAWCQEHGVMYCNTATELWEEDAIQGNWFTIWKEAQAPGISAAQKAAAVKPLLTRTLYMRQHEIRETYASRKGGPTAVLDHGMNPGLVSHFVKCALEKIAESVFQASANISVQRRRALENLRSAYTRADFGRMAMILGLRVIHISEKDNQLPVRGAEKKPDEFLSTWSCPGFFEEGCDPIQIGWGTHELKLPHGAVIPPVGNQAQIFLPIRGVDLKMRSYVPTFGEITGFNIPHSENSTIAAELTVTLPNTTNKSPRVLYRPTVHFVYHAPPCAMESWDQIIQRGDYDFLDQHRVLTGFEIASGRDAVGTLLIFKHDPTRFVLHGDKSTRPFSYWAGTILDIEETRRVIGEDPNPTTVQVVAGVTSAIKWMLDNPREGVCWPERLPHNFILNQAAPYLGDVVFKNVQWGKEPPSLQFVDFVHSGDALGIRPKGKLRLREGFSLK